MIEQAFSSPTCFSAANLIGADKIAVSVVFFSAAVFVLLYMSGRKMPTNRKLALIYTHLFLIAFPFVLLSTNAACGTLCMTCHNNIPSLLLLSLPAAIGVSATLGFVALPTFYMASSKRKLHNGPAAAFVGKYSKMLSIRKPALYLVDKARPSAFSFRSFRPAVFISVGAVEMLTKKELEAVLLHEMAHLKRWSSAVKLSSAITRALSPMSLLVNFHDSGEEEEEADNFAIKEQGTSRYLESAKRKFEAFE